MPDDVRKLHIRQYTHVLYKRRQLILECIDRQSYVSHPQSLSSKLLVPICMLPMPRPKAVQWDTIHYIFRANKSGIKFRIEMVMKYFPDFVTVRVNIINVSLQRV